MKPPTPNERLAFTDAALSLQQQALRYLAKADAPKSIAALRLAISSTKGAVRNASSRAARAERVKNCKHLTGYWINQAQRNFRCYGCQGQFHIGDNLPSDHPKGGIEMWEGQYRR